MKLWMTKNGFGSLFGWAGEQPSLCGGEWHKGDGTIPISEALKDMPRCTCTELYTEERVRRMVAETLARKGDTDEESFSLAHRYLSDPTDINWRALASAIWPEGESDASVAREEK